MNTVILAGLMQIRGEDKKTFVSKISPIIFSIAGHYPGLPKIKITQVNKNWFKPENLYKFWHFKDCKNIDRVNNIIFKFCQMKIKKTISTLCIFGNTIKILLDGFLNYYMVMVKLFRVFFPSLFWLVLTYHSKICHLSHIYD